jgi:hypothetical protein
VSATQTIGTIADDDEHQYCYRHPDRETWVRCGRCDRPICTSCAMQGPVGSRCRQCGKLAFDPLTSFTPAQLLLGILTAVGGGLIAGFIVARIGFFAIFVSYFGGGIVADLVMRATGYKRGPVMLGIVLGGLALGILAGAAAGFWVEYSTVLDAAAAAGADPEDAALSIQPLLLDALTWAVISAAAACAGAWSRVRFLS